MGLTLITPPAGGPLSLSEIKKHLLVEHDEQDDLIALYAAAATQWIDGPSWLGGRTIMPQTWDLTLDTFPSHEIKLPLIPVQSIQQIAYDDVDGNETFMNNADYELDASGYPVWVVPVTGWPSTVEAINAVRIRFVAGYQDATQVPAPIKAAILLLIGHLFANREEVAPGLPPRTQIPVGATDLLSPWRIMYC
jgi:uncharacterized phiE125 gp8 family phage protein